MPWDIAKRFGKFCVVKQGSDDEPEGCHSTRAEAVAQMKALYASESNLAADLAANESNLGYSVGDIEDAVAHLKLAIAALGEEAQEGLSMHLEEALAALGEYGEDDPLIANGDRQEHGWSGPIVFENVVTGDNRVFKTGSIVWEVETLPWTLRWQKHSGQGHAGSVPVGRVDKIERQEEGSIFGYGVVIPSLNDEAGEYLRLLESGVGGGVSVDGDSAQFEIQEMAEGGQPRIEFSAMRLRALSAVDIPAFNGARIRLIDTEPESVEEEVVLQDGDAVLQDAEPDLQDGEPDLRGDLQVAQVEEVAEEVVPADGEPASVDLREELAKKRILASEASGSRTDGSEPSETEELSELELLEAELEALNQEIEAGLTPADRDALLHADVRQTGMTDGWQVDQSLVAAAIPVAPSTEAFLEPEFGGPTALSISPDGKVAGHLALFNSCHIGFPNACVKPPKGSNYQYFHTGEIETSEGDLVSVGHLTFKTGHAAMHASPRAAAEHYDNTGAVAADVRAGEDQFGIWVVGALRNHLSEEDIRAFRSAPLSGDWRRIAGKLELVGALAVNVPGFPVPRVKALVASGETETLFTYLEDGDENFVDQEPSSMSLDDRLETKTTLAQRLELALGEKDDDDVPDEKIPDDDLPDPPSRKEFEELAKKMTKAQLLASLKDIRDFLDDPDAELSATDRKKIERLYGAFISTDEKGKKTDASGMDVDEFYNAWELSGLDIEEFYNSCHSPEDGKFCGVKGGDGKGLSGQARGGGRGNNNNRNNNNRNNNNRKNNNRNNNNRNNNNRNNNNRNSNNKPSAVKEWQNYKSSKKAAFGWAAVTAVAAAVQHSEVARSLLTSVTTPFGVPIIGSPAFAAAMFLAGAISSYKHSRNAAKYRKQFNTSIAKVTKADREAAEIARVRARQAARP